MLECIVHAIYCKMKIPFEKLIFMFLLKTFVIDTPTIYLLEQRSEQMLCPSKPEFNYMKLGFKKVPRKHFMDMFSLCSEKKS